MATPAAISVAMATYNGEKFIRQQLDSIASQSLLPSELVITDDASTDDTIAVVEQFAATAPFPTHIYQNPVRLGYRANFMRALSLCQAPILALCDQDDVWDREKLATAIKAFEQPDTVLFVHNAWVIDSDGARLRMLDTLRMAGRNPPLSIHSLVSPLGFSMVCHRSLLAFSDLWARSIDSNDPRSPMGHDQWLFFLASIFGTVAYWDQPLAGYRQHADNTFGAPKRGLRTQLRHRMYRLIDYGSKCAQLAQAAETRAVILATSQSRLDGIWLERAVAGEQACRRLANRLALRSCLYSQSSMRSRYNVVRQLQRDGAYKADGGFGIGGSVLTDAIRGIPLQRLLGQGQGQVNRL